MTVRRGGVAAGRRDTVAGDRQRPLLMGRHLGGDEDGGAEPDPDLAVLHAVSSRRVKAAGRPASSDLLKMQAFPGTGQPPGLPGNWYEVMQLPAIADVLLAEDAAEIRAALLMPRSRTARPHGWLERAPRQGQ